MTKSADFLSLDHITIRSINKVLFSDINFEVKRGQHWALIGESGSGKSALLQAIAGKLNVSNGQIVHHYFNEYLKHSPGLQDGLFTYHKLLALVEPRHHFKNLSNTTDFYYQQRYNSFDSEDALTAGDYLDSIVHLPGNDYWNKAKVVKLLYLDTLLPKQIIKLSNGETKRLRLASALLKNPMLLLLDNPLAGLDVQTRAEFDSILQEITASGITVIMTAAPGEMPAAITNIAVLAGGSTIQTFNREDFKPEDFSHYNNVHVDLSAIQQLIDVPRESPYTYIIKMQDVSTKYGSNNVLSHVNWEVKPGDRWALIGANGAGKSTLLSLINGDNPQAYANNIILFDKKRGTGESIWDIKAKIGFVSPELYQYFPADNSCLQVIESGYFDTLGLFRQSSPQRQEKALAWMKLLEIDKYAHMPLKNIPAAAQRLCLLARALIKNPPLLIFDEPCQGLDSHQQLHFKKVVDELCRLTDVTLIYVTHYQHEIPDSVDKVLRLEKGEVV
ncbi:ABC transporter [Mucilaginibacter hurinus]|uniref:ABC transporter n=1 Tax=Mucilaginibacter hurinus TaxID=2201324 RepID=A0A367GKQ6_9SPHI|nr:ATP-binding cassette domain-containing protein [Mucilaginibacter hurinus]RCH53900.1 ABC transporter [Mucilaginibacter hurinus]